MDLKHLGFTEVLDNGTVTVKSGLFEQKKDWVQLKLPELEDHFNNLGPENVRDGKKGLYIQSAIDYYGAPLWMFILDVEHNTQHHTSLQANIDTAKNLYYLFDSYNIASDLVISLTGNGFRFLIPCIIPYTHSNAFLEMVKDKRRFPGIDPAPQSSTSQFIRLLAYRGNTMQGRSQKDIHIHTLENACDVLSLDEEKYQSLVRGKPDIDKYRRDLKRMIPCGFAPEALIEILDGYNTQIHLKSTIASPLAGRAQKKYQVNLDAILSYVENELGITHEKLEWSEGAVYRLDTCPACGESEGNPWITPNGYLKCRRANNCPAGPEGMPPSQWVEDYQAIEAEDEPSEINAPGLSLEDARRINEKTIEEALETGGSVAVNTSMGVGKTHTAINKAVPEAAEKRILFTVPTKELAAEVENKVRQKAEVSGLDINIRRIVGRNEDNCKQSEEISDAAEKGYTPAYVICVGCAHQKGCAYLEQFENIPETGLVITTHDTASFHKERIAPDIWIIDENSVNQFFVVYKSTQAQMNELRELETEDVRPLFDRIREIAVRAASVMKEYDEARFYVGFTPPGRWENACTLENIETEIANYFENGLFPTQLSLHHMEDPLSEFRWQRYAFKKKVKLETVRFWDQIIYEDEDALAYVKASVPGGNPNIEYVVVKFSPPQLDNCHIIHLDGTMYEPEIKELFPEDVKIKDAQVKLDSCRKVHVKASRGKTKMMKFTRHKIEQDLEYLLSLLRPQDQKVLLVTHKFTEDRVKEAAMSLRQDIQFGLYHFWGPRGINSFEDFDACIAYGTPTVNSNSVSDQAMMLFDNEEDIAAWEDSLRKRDVAQAVHRIRPVNGDKNIIIMGSYWPTAYLGRPDQQIDRMRKGENYQEAKERLLAFARGYGFIDKAVAMLLGVATRQDERALHTIQEKIARGEIGGSYFVPTLIDIYKSGDKFQGTFSAIFLPRNSGWKKLMEDIHAETGLPYLWFNSKGPGRKSLALGSVEAVKAFCDLAGTRFDPDQYEPYLAK